MSKSLTVRKLSAIPFSSVEISDAFWSPILEANQCVTLKACLDKCEETGRIANFARAAGLEQGDFEGIFFNDSDVYKVLEGVAYSLTNNRDPALESQADRIIELIAAAQQKDGYLDTWFTLTAPDKRWTNMEMHECYCAGHLIEAAVAYWRATGKRKFLVVACRLADHMDSLFGPGKRHWVTGHEELELALVKLYHVTGEERYLKLADWLLGERGHGWGVGGIWSNSEWGAKYCQDDRPVREMTDISGHAVRAMYLYSGMADVAAETGDAGYVEALERLWESTVLRNMYITGGIGSSKRNEGFTEDYDLPNDEAYCETCASIGMVYWNHRMNLMTGEARYADVMERALYNGALAGVSFSGDRFFYVNPLESKGDHHRQEWFDCACCPTQVARFLPSVGSYAYAVSEDALWVNLFLSCRAEFEFMGGALRVRQETGYPWSGSVGLVFEKVPGGSFAVNIRKPGWCRKAGVSVGGLAADAPACDGYIRLQGQWREGDRIEIELEMPVERNHAHPSVKADAGRVAFSRGPVVYCFEQCDNGEDAFDAIVGPDAECSVGQAAGLPGIPAIRIKNKQGNELTAVPYYAWDNREPGWMRVWMKEV